jgi:hypothetical protein
MDGPRERTIQKAFDLLLGSKERLAAALEIPPEDLDAYLDGSRQIPQEVFLRAIDIVAGINGGTR